RLEALAHASENVLGKIRDGELPVTPAAVTLILESLDGIKSILAALEATEAEPEGDDAGLIGRLNSLAAGETATASVAKTVNSRKRAKRGAAAAEKAPPAVAQPAPMPEPAVAEAPEAVPVARAAEDLAKESLVAAQSIRVNVDLLENLMTMVSELVLTRNQLLQILRSQKDSEFGAPL